MSKKVLRIATRRSKLALWQANFISNKLINLNKINNPDLELKIELVEIVTKGDKILDTPLAKIGGKALFVKELENKLLDKTADIAVHSMKDVPAELPKGLTLGVICERENPFDALLSVKYKSLEELKQKSKSNKLAKLTIGTSSLRRKLQIQAIDPTFEILDLRGNVDTRINKLIENQYDAIILAAAGLNRLNLTQNIIHIFNEQEILPAVGQGALGIECRENDPEILNIISLLDQKITRACVSAERAMNFKLNGGCQVPIAGYATNNNKTITLKGLVGNLDGSIILKAQDSAPIDQVINLGSKIAEDLLSQGAGPILESIYSE